VLTTRHQANVVPLRRPVTIASRPAQPAILASLPAGRVVLFQTAALAYVGCSVVMSGLKQPINILFDSAIYL
jgi:hypothetical protein